MVLDHVASALQPLVARVSQFCVDRLVFCSQSYATGIDLYPPSSGIGRDMAADVDDRWARHTIFGYVAARTFPEPLQRCLSRRARNIFQLLLLFGFSFAGFFSLSSLSFAPALAVPFLAVPRLFLQTCSRGGSYA